MTRRREVDRRKRSLTQIREVMDSMKSLAYMETRKLERRLENQRQLIDGIKRAAADFLSFHGYESSRAYGSPRDGGVTPVVVVIGAERGFCGGFNEEVLTRLASRVEAPDLPPPRLITVGSRLSTRLAGNPQVAAANEGADVAEETNQVLGRIAAALEEIRSEHGPVSLAAIYQRHDPREIRSESLLPPFEELLGAEPAYPVAPLLNLPPRELFLGLVEQYVLAALQEMLYSSLMAENQRRVQHLDSAIRHIDQRVEELRRESNRLRQEEIIEEIEVILLGASELQGPHPHTDRIP